MVKLVNCIEIGNVRKNTYFLSERIWTVLFSWDGCYCSYPRLPTLRLPLLLFSVCCSLYLLQSQVMYETNYLFIRKVQYNVYQVHFRKIYTCTWFPLFPVFILSKAFSFTTIKNGMIWYRNDFIEFQHCTPFFASKQ